MATLLSRLHYEQRKAGPTPYLDTLLAAFPKRRCAGMARAKRIAADNPLCETYTRGKNAMGMSQLKQVREYPVTYPLVDPLSDRELEVLQLLARGASNQEIARELAIVVDTVKRHVSQIFSKLAVKNRLQAIGRARELNLLDESFNS
jgi:LuxR family maltose regulon positive regulatory protein